MQLTRQTEYAIRALLELTSAPKGSVLQSAAIARKHGLPEYYLNKTVQLLVRAGLVQSKRGMNGGISLSVPSEEITIKDVLIAIEGKVALNPCLEDHYNCVRMPYCEVRKIFMRAQEALLGELSKESLADLVKASTIAHQEETTLQDHD